MPEQISSSHSSRASRSGDVDERRRPEQRRHHREVHREVRQPAHRATASADGTASAISSAMTAVIQPCARGGRTLLFALDQPPANAARLIANAETRIGRRKGCVPGQVQQRGQRGLADDEQLRQSPTARGRAAIDSAAAASPTRRGPRSSQPPPQPAATSLIEIHERPARTRPDRRAAPPPAARARRAVGAAPRFAGTALDRRRQPRRIARRVRQRGHVRRRRAPLRRRRG